MVTRIWKLHGLHKSVTKRLEKGKKICVNFCFNSVFEDKWAMQVSVYICLRLLSQLWVKRIILLIRVSWRRIFVKTGVIKADYTLFFYKQLGSGLSPQSCLYFQGFWVSKLLNGCLVVLPSNLCLRGLQ